MTYRIFISISPRNWGVARRNFFFRYYLPFKESYLDSFLTDLNRLQSRYFFTAVDLHFGSIRRVAYSYGLRIGFPPSKKRKFSRALLGFNFLNSEYPGLSLRYYSGWWKLTFIVTLFTCWTLLTLVPFKTSPNVSLSCVETLNCSGALNFLSPSLLHLHGYNPVILTGLLNPLQCLQLVFIYILLKFLTSQHTHALAFWAFSQLSCLFAVIVFYGMEPLGYFFFLSEISALFALLIVCTSQRSKLSDPWRSYSVVVLTMPLLFWTGGYQYSQYTYFRFYTAIWINTGNDFVMYLHSIFTTSNATLIVLLLFLYSLLLIRACSLKGIRLGNPLKRLLKSNFYTYRKSFLGRWRSK